MKPVIILIFTAFITNKLTLCQSVSLELSFYETYFNFNPHQRVRYFEDYFKSEKQLNVDEFNIIFDDLSIFLNKKVREYTMFEIISLTGEVFIKNDSLFDSFISDLRYALNIKSFIRSQNDKDDFCLLIYPNKYMYLSMYVKNSIRNRIVFLENSISILPPEYLNIFKSDLDRIFDTNTQNFTNDINSNQKIFNIAKKNWLSFYE